MTSLMLATSHALIVGQRATLADQLNLMADWGVMAEQPELVVRLGEPERNPDTVAGKHSKCCCVGPWNPPRR